MSLILVILALQLANVSAPWRVIERATVNWKPGGPAYQILVEESIPSTRDEDPHHRIRIVVSGHDDFTVVRRSAVELLVRGELSQPGSTRRRKRIHHRLVIRPRRLEHVKAVIGPIDPPHVPRRRHRL